MTGRHRLGDGTVITVPMNAAWFDAYGWSVENKGVEPDLEALRTPLDWAEGRYAVLDDAVRLALDLLEATPRRHPPLTATCPTAPGRSCRPGREKGRPFATGRPFHISARRAQTCSALGVRPRSPGRPAPRTPAGAAARPCPRPPAAAALHLLLALLGTLLGLLLNCSDFSWNWSIIPMWVHCPVVG
ncbi:hypothetical protein GCM10023238_15170 [Streptomyces heliomycini]